MPHVFLFPRKVGEGHGDSVVDLDDMEWQDEEDYTTSLHCESLFLFVVSTLFDCAVVVIIRVIPLEKYQGVRALPIVAASNQVLVPGLHVSMIRAGQGFGRRAWNVHAAL